MKIGVLTFHRPINYGAFLQSFGLSTYLHHVLPDADIEIIDYLAPKERKKIYINILRRIKYNGIIAGYKEVHKIRIFRNSLKELSLSNDYFCTENQEKLFKYIDDTYDLLIIGSDAVFNWEQNGYPTAFIPQYSFSIPVMTYAASVHGLKYLDEPQDRLNECGRVFERMECVFTRDENTNTFVKKCSNVVDVKHSCDPTFLIDFSDLYSLAHRDLETIKHKYSINRQYIVVMLQDEEISKHIYDRYSNRYTIVSLFLDNKYSDCFVFDLTPAEWCLFLKNAEIVVTNLFHGTLLSLQQNTPAIAVDTSHYFGVYEGKLHDLMSKRIGVDELYFRIESFDEKKFFEVFDKALNGDFFERIEEGVRKERATVDLFLNKLNSIFEKQGAELL